MTRPLSPARVESPDAAETAAWSDPALAARPPLLDARPLPETAGAEPVSVSFAPTAREPEEGGVTALQRLVAAHREPVTVEVAGRDGIDAPEPPRGTAGELGRERADRVAEAVAAVAPPGSRVVARAEPVVPGTRRTDGRRAQVRLRPGAPTADPVPTAGPGATGRPDGTPPAPRDRPADPAPPPTAGAAATGAGAPLGAAVPGRAPAVRDGESRRGTPQPRYRRVGEGAGATPGPHRPPDVNGLDLPGAAGPGADAAGWRPAIRRPASSDPTGRSGPAYDLDLAALTPAYGLRGAAPVPTDHAQRLRDLAAAWDDRLRDAGVPAADARRLVHVGLAQAADRALVFTGLEPPERFVLDERLLPHPPAPGAATDARALLARLLGPASPEGATP